MDQAPAGWYPDAAVPPGRTPSLRYWDGQNWTEHVAPSVAQAGTALHPVPTTPDGVPLAGWWWRVLAYLIDSFGVGVVATIATIPLQLSFQRHFTAMFDRLVLEADHEPGFSEIVQPLMGLYLNLVFWLTLGSAIAWTLYYIVMLRWKGATFGMMACGLRVRLREQEGRLPWSTVALRAAVQWSMAAVAAAIGLLTGSVPLGLALLGLNALYSYLDPLWATWDDKNQALHDKAARTNVVRTR